MNGSPRLSFSISTTPAMSYTGISSSRSSTPIMTSAAPADPCLRHRALASRRGRAALRQDPVGCRGARPLRRLVRHIRQRWTRTRITFRGDGHYARPEAMEWCEADHIDYVSRAARFEAAGEENRRGGGRGAHRARFVEQARRARLRRNAPQGQILEPRAARRRPHRSHSARARHRFVVTNVEYGAAEWIYAALYCARGQAENLIKLHKTQLASDRTSFVPRSQIRSASRCTRRLTGSCSPFATPSRNRAISPTPSSRPCDCG